MVDQRWVRAPIDQLSPGPKRFWEVIFVSAERECAVPLLHEEEHRSEPAGPIRAGIHADPDLECP